MKNSLIIVAMCFINQVRALDSNDLGIETATCYGCAGGTNKMCVPSAISLPDKSSVVCCKESILDEATSTPEAPVYTFTGNMDKSYCQASKDNKCSATYKSSPAKWYAFCP